MEFVIAPIHEFFSRTLAADPGSPPLHNQNEIESHCEKDSAAQHPERNSSRHPFTPAVPDRMKARQTPAVPDFVMSTSPVRRQVFRVNRFYAREMIVGSNLVRLRLSTAVSGVRAWF
jgi:hypothetical protein